MKTLDQLIEEYKITNNESILPKIRRGALRINLIKEQKNNILTFMKAKSKICNKK